MKFAIDLVVCQNMGQCAFTAPDMFELDADGDLAFRQVADDEFVSPELNDEQVKLAQAAMSACPMQAIRVE